MIYEDNIHEEHRTCSNKNVTNLEATHWELGIVIAKAVVPNGREKKAPEILTKLLCLLITIAEHPRVKIVALIFLR